MSKRSGSYPITKGGRVEGFRQRGSKKKAPTRTRVKVRTIKAPIKAQVKEITKILKEMFYDPDRNDTVFGLVDEELEAIAEELIEASRGEYARERVMETLKVHFDTNRLGLDDSDFSDIIDDMRLPILPKVPENIEVVYPNDTGSGFFEAWDAEEFYIWAEKAKEALARAVPLEEVESLWRSIPIYEMASVDGDRSTVITYADGETFIVDVEDALRARQRPLVDSDAFTARELQHELKTERERRRKMD